MGNKISSTRSTFHLEKTNLNENVLKYLLDNTKMTREQIIDFHDNFLRDCPNGYLTKKEFIKMFKELYQNKTSHGKADKFCEYVFKAIDANSNNLIEFDDFIICFSINSFGSLQEKIELAFKIFDLNKDGVLDKYEFAKVLEALLDFTYDPEEKKENRNVKQIVDNLIKKIDKNRNHLIEYDEFYNGCVEDEYVRSILVEKIFNS